MHVSGFRTFFICIAIKQTKARTIGSSHNFISRQLRIIVRNFGDSFSIDHFLHVLGHSLDDPLEELSSLLCRSQRWLLVRLLLHHFLADILWKGGQGYSGLKLLSVPWQILGAAMLEQLFSVRRGKNVPVG